MRYPTALEIRCDPKLIAVFRAAAKKSFPREAYGLFLGRAEPRGAIEVEDLVICPPEGVEKASQWLVVPKLDWLKRAVERAGAEDLMIVGDIHSHCAKPKDGFYAKTSPSEGDWGDTPRFQKVLGPEFSFMAIMALNKGRARMRSRITFWPLLPALEVSWRDN